MSISRYACARLISSFYLRVLTPPAVPQRHPHPRPVRVPHPLRQHHSRPPRLTDRRTQLLGQPQRIQPANGLQTRTLILLIRGSHTFMVLPVSPAGQGPRVTCAACR
ncbi:hypothetical protein BGM19_00370 [Streptomyces agglomeratus]|nr:hypothetical protein BGM19_00370 [Streptomyces agglomeratus]